MFPIAIARIACEQLRAAGADLVFREIDDLSHTYPREENDRILDLVRSVAGVAGSGKRRVK